jgi:threonine/homoserine/homoserine lactone efflux protein
VAAGFGPISVLALNSGLRHGFAPAFGVAVAVALVDGFYALLAGLGLAFSAVLADSPPPARRHRPAAPPRSTRWARVSAASTSPSC